MAILALIIFAFLLAEIAGGIFHWWEDRYGNPDWPILGEYIVKPNIEHHRNPSAMCKGTYLDRNLGTMLACSFGIILFHWSWFMCLFFAVLSQMNEFHNWTHKKSNRFIRWLQNYLILQSPQHHSIHHKRPFDRNYCVMTNFMNPFLEYISFWDGLEALVYLVCGAKPLSERTLL